uniref:Retroelement n=2 Tax=Oryza sativa subsp. japonica TaxID=39947 RepID=A0A5S6RCV4_ORYSJ|nr:Putative retroelement [Oryza sativa Japonica Group]AAP52858.1 retrotransposon, putative, centromere-specific [Oryza sativa Japonica Group]
MCPFQIVYGLLPRAPIDLMPLPSSEKLNFDAKQHVELMLKLHETTKENIEHMNAKYKFASDKGRRELNFEPGDLVWLHLRKERFPDLRKSKLMPRADGPFKVLAKINENAYKLDLPADYKLLVHLVLAGSRLLAGTNTLVVGLIVHPSRFTTTSGVGVTIAKAQHLWIVVVGSPTSLHPIDLSLSSKDWDTLEHIKYRNSHIINHFTKILHANLR